MRLVVEDTPGEIFFGEAHPDFLQLRPLYCFVPDGTSYKNYGDSRWPSINSGANPHAVGSHVLPNWSRPARNLDCPTLKKFVENLPRFIAKATRQ